MVEKPKNATNDTANSKKRVIVVVNKYWECDPVCWVLTNSYLTDECNYTDKKYIIDLDVENSLTLLTYPTYGSAKPFEGSGTIPRMVFETEKRNIEVWCISDLLSNSGSELQSSSEEKMKLLPQIYEYEYLGEKLDIEMVIAVGTASAGPCVTSDSPFGTDNINGAVIIGSNVFMHDGWEQGSLSKFECDCWGQIMPSCSNDYIRELEEVDFKNYKGLMLSPPNNPSTVETPVYVSENYVALGSVNVTNYNLYSTKDKETAKTFFENYPGSHDGVSLETTHCLIYLAAKDYLCSNPPFMFVSGIVDRFLCFDSDVDPTPYAQNVSGAHNAGVAVAYIISQLEK
ncbi:hypothetical protein [Methanococcus voltae]|uniref:Uncharacterized protein n=1 Tax=Methanococcus voltae TaxID=2188 RepID=A0A8J7RHN5_METVO|nr:hypothetical protein [Methanococcus voltae]MBP2173166.1 hypothetical protein [Methanococcus voltae]MBP2202042.1 hypothetical protein [Methanococcus voltae]